MIGLLPLELTGFQLGEYKGVIDGATHVTLTVPADANLPDPSEAKISTDGSVKSNLFAGSIESGQLLYRLTPYAAWTGAVYNGTGGYVFDKDLGKTWIVEVKRGDPVLKVQDLSITLGERIYHAQIDDEESDHQPHIADRDESDLSDTGIEAYSVDGNDWWKSRRNSVGFKQTGAR